MLRNIMAVLSYNYIITISVSGWLAAQILKTIVFVIINRKFNIERMVGAGGWPSSHAALVCSMLVATAKTQGGSSPIFAIAFAFALVVMYDAMGVRREAGNQARVINVLIRERIVELRRKEENGDKVDYAEEIGLQLKEMVGHTPFQVLCGAILGFSIGFFVPVF